MSTVPVPSDGEPLLPTVTHRYLPHPDSEMSLIGWTMFLLLLVLVIPLLPFVAVTWLVSKAVESLRR